MAAPVIAGIALSAAAIIAIARTAFNALFVVVTYAGLQTILGQVEGYLASSLSGLPAEFAGLAGLIGLDVGLSLIMSAFTVRLAMAVMQRVVAK